ncbi:hypothetical protein GXW78_07545 [Roseomonas terrae]|uniref:Major capsid protein n=1 Tax=Neoroseomonas terrae TaxID=424799 RepID=A0ABS5EER9_9PROT|nr:hypothetical protein [Neoroseomonas terrae]MBR0649508.1 hypothetical protein [Neoroseomonas terrae]
MSDTIRKRIRALALKQETTQGVDAIAGTPSPSDYVTCRWTVRPVRDLVQNPGESGAYDDLAPIPAGARAELRIAVPMVGSGTAGQAPEWGKAMKACRMEEVVTAAAVGAPTAAASGTGTTVTAASPFGTTAQQYRGMAILLTGNPAAGAVDVVIDYTTGRVVSLGRTYSPILSSGTSLQIPTNVLYRPISDESQEAGLTAYIYEDGLRHRFLGMKGSWGIGLIAGQPASLVYTLTGMVAAYKEAATMVTNFVPVTRRPPLWMGGMSQLNRAVADVQSVNFEMGNRSYYTENPEAPQGYDVPILTGASPRYTLNPFSRTTRSPARAGAWESGVPMPYAAIWGATAGNRFALSCPSAQVTELGDEERGELGVDSIVLTPDTPNAGAFLCCF